MANKEAEELSQLVDMSPSTREKVNEALAEWRVFVNNHLMKSTIPNISYLETAEGKIVKDEFIGFMEKRIKTMFEAHFLIHDLEESYRSMLDENKRPRSRNMKK